MGRSLQPGCNRGPPSGGLLPDHTLCSSPSWAASSVGSAPYGGGQRFDSPAVHQPIYAQEWGPARPESGRRRPESALDKCSASAPGVTPRDPPSPGSTGWGFAGSVAWHAGRLFLARLHLRPLAQPSASWRSGRRPPRPASRHRLDSTDAYEPDQSARVETLELPAIAV